MIVEAAQASDRRDILAVTSRIDIFSGEEKGTVRELWDEREIGYEFFVARHDGEVVGYACFGERDLTKGGYDLYWIAVDPSARRLGVGAALMGRIDSEVRARGGRLIVVETSGTEVYASTRLFYESVGYKKEAVIPDFYKEGDGLMIYVKRL